MLGLYSWSKRDLTIDALYIYKEDFRMSFKKKKKTENESRSILSPLVIAASVPALSLVNDQKNIH